MTKLVKVYKDGDFALVEPEQVDAFTANGWSKKAEPKKNAAPKRARNTDGTLKADDPKTPDVNEAWEGGEAPKPIKRGRPRKK